MITGTKTRRGRRVTAVLAAGILTTLVLSGCSRADSGGGDEAAKGEALPVGSSAEDFQAALADMEPTTLIFQTTSASPDSPDSAPTNEFIKRVEEYSGGKITLETTWANGIVSNTTEVDKAIADGRIDIGYAWPQYNPSEYPANNLLMNASVVRDPQMVPGYFSIMASLQQAGLETPEVMEEYEKNGITPLVIMSADGPSIIACSEPVLTLADLKGKQIRAGGVVHARQLEELGAVPVSLPYPEVYEALQRGILDCSMSAHAIATTGGHTEVAPYVMHTTTASFASTPTNLYAGPKFKTLPVAAQQLILEAVDTMRGENIEAGLIRIAGEAAEIAAGKGGGYFEFDPEVDEKLAEINKGILADIASSDVLDGKALVERVEAANADWNKRVIELGYVDDGPASEFPEWFSGVDYKPWVDAVSEQITQKRLK